MTTLGIFAVTGPGWHFWPQRELSWMECEPALLATLPRS
jgi:hypothetical protein